MKTARESTGQSIRWFCGKTSREGAMLSKKNSKEFKNGYLFTLIY
jgi:hypothetical protein